MGCECNKTSNTCGEELYAACVHFEGVLPSFSTLYGETCQSVEEVIADIYLLLTDIKDEIDLTDLLTNGIAYELVGGNLPVKNALKKHAELLLSMQATLDSLTDGTNEIFNISGWGLDFDCLADACDNPPVYLKDLIQIMITQICANVTP